MSMVQCVYFIGQFCNRSFSGLLRGFIEMARLSGTLSFTKTVVLTTFGLVLLALSNRPQTLSIPALTHETFTKDTPLSCEEIVKVTQWGSLRYGGPKHQALKSPQIGQRFLQVFLEKLDPHKLLFTQNEVEDFKREGLKNWQSLVSAGNCGYFDAWVRAHYPVAKLRVEARIALLPVETIFRKTKASESTRLKKFTHFASSAKELAERLEWAADAIAQGTSKQVIAAYANKRQILIEGFNEVLFEATASPSTLVAKSLLGTFDPYSTYFSKTEFEDFYSDLSAGTTGIGIRVQKVPQGFLVEKIVKNSSAADSRAIHEGDVITAIDGIPVEMVSMVDVRDLLKGEADTIVNLKLLDLKTQDQHTIALKRQHFDFEEARVKEKTVQAKGAEVAVVEIPNFYGKAGFGEDESEETTSSMDLKEVLEKIVNQPKKVKSVVLDLRGNPGGFLEEAVSMAGMFVGNKPVVGVVEQEKTRVMQDELAKAPLYQGPLVVLVDEGTASAGEVLAGALKDLQRAVVVGSSKTYGKGSVQKLFHLDDDLLQIGLKHQSGNGVLKLTTSVFYSPLGHSPANGGVKSDIAFAKTIRKETLEEYGHAALMEVPEIQPFLDDIALSQLRLKEQINQKTLELLRGKSSERMHRIESNSNQDLELEEAVSIAADLGEMSRGEL